jgi:hypothetical protein
MHDLPGDHTTNKDDVPLLISTSDDHDQLQLPPPKRSVQQRTSKSAAGSVVLHPASASTTSTANQTGASVALTDDETDQSTGAEAADALSPQPLVCCARQGPIQNHTCIGSLLSSVVSNMSNISWHTRHSATNAANDGSVIQQQQQQDDAPKKKKKKVGIREQSLPTPRMINSFPLHRQRRKKQYYEKGLVGLAYALMRHWFLTVHRIFLVQRSPTYLWWPLVVSVTLAMPAVTLLVVPVTAMLCQHGHAWVKGLAEAVPTPTMAMRFLRRIRNHVRYRLHQFTSPAGAQQRMRFVWLAVIAVQSLRRALFDPKPATRSRHDRRQKPQRQ